MEKRTENQAKEIKLITASYTGEYEILTVVPKLGAQKVYDPNDYPELEPIMDEFGSLVDSIWVGTTTTNDDGDFEPEKYTQQVKDTIVMKVEKSVGQGLIKNELGNGCTVYTIDDAGMSLNIYDTDYGFWVTLVYNLD